MKKLLLLTIFLLGLFVVVGNGTVSAETNQRYTCHEIRFWPAQCGALQALHDAGFGSNWFNSTALCTDWEGVTCSRGSCPGYITAPTVTCIGVSRLILKDATMHHIPYELGNIRTLQELKLDNVRLTDHLGGNLKYCALRKLEITNSPQIELPYDIGAVKFLSTLIISNSGVTRLPDSIGNLFFLRHLSLQRNPTLNHIPPTVGQIEELMRLRITDNPRLASVPAEIGNMHGIVQLEIARNPRLKSVPATLHREQFLKVETYWIDVPLDSAENDPNEGSGCQIPPSGPWPRCTTGQPIPVEPSAPCVIPLSGPWPLCARNGGSPPSIGSGDCVIPPKGPWPPCAR